MILNGFKKIIFQNEYVGLETPPPPFMEKTILNVHFDYLTPSLITRVIMGVMVIEKIMTVDSIISGALWMPLGDLNR